MSMFNNFFIKGRETLPKPPSTVYAKLDKIEDASDALGTDLAFVYFDAVDATWFNEFRYSLIQTKHDQNKQKALLEKAPISIVVGKQHLLFPDTAPAEGGWYLLDFDKGDVPVEQHFGLLDAPTERIMTRPNTVSEELGEDLDKAFSLSAIPDATENDIKQALLRCSHDIQAVAVYDVGQGNCTALLRDIYRPVPAVYFDFGGGALANKKTFPDALKHFCTSFRPPVILSHWDWDHWSSAQRDLRILGHDWIVPRQEMGAVHRVLAANIQAKGRLLIYPKALPRVDVNQLSLRQCGMNLKRNIKNRNDTGLAFIVGNSTGDRHILLPGDAKYRAIFGRSLPSFTALVTPHHGADTKSFRVPTPDFSSANRVAYSYGKHNTFNHPKQVTISDHFKENWNKPLSTADGGAAANRQPNHLVLTFDGSYRYKSRNRLMPPCNNLGCQLELVDG